MEGKITLGVRDFPRSLAFCFEPHGEDDGAAIPAISPISMAICENWLSIPTLT